MQLSKSYINFKLNPSKLSIYLISKMRQSGIILNLNDTDSELLKRCKIKYVYLQLQQKEST